MITFFYIIQRLIENNKNNELINYNLSFLDIRSDFNINDNNIYYYTFPYFKNLIIIMLYYKNYRNHRNIYNQLNQLNQDNRDKEENNETNIINEYIIYKLLFFKGIINNSFINDDVKNKFSHIFSLSQKHYYYLNKFCYIYKLKKSNIIVDKDLYLNNININNPNTIVIFQNNYRYLFTLKDLINIIETSLCNSQDFFINSFKPKNPYNNTIFNNSTLFYIYLKMKNNYNIISLIFHFYFIEFFNIENFKLNNETYIYEVIIKKFINNSYYSNLIEYIFEMLSDNIYTNKLIIHEEFPKKLLVDIFKPYLYYFFITNYTIYDSNKINKCKNILFEKLKKFYEYNKFFGRKIIQIKKNDEIETFNSLHIKF